MGESTEVLEGEPVDQDLPLASLAAQQQEAPSQLKMSSFQERKIATIYYFSHTSFLFSIFPREIFATQKSKANPEKSKSLNHYVGRGFQFLFKNLFFEKQILEKKYIYLNNIFY